MRAIWPTTSPMDTDKLEKLESVSLSAWNNAAWAALAPTWSSKSCKNHLIDKKRTQTQLRILIRIFIEECHDNMKSCQGSGNLFGIVVCIHCFHGGIDSCWKSGRGSLLRIVICNNCLHTGIGHCNGLRHDDEPSQRFTVFFCELYVRWTINITEEVNITRFIIISNCNNWVNFQLLNDWRVHHDKQVLILFNRGLTHLKTPNKGLIPLLWMHYYRGHSLLGSAAGRNSSMEGFVTL